MVIDKLFIKHDDVTDEVNVRRLKFRKRAAIFGALKGDLDDISKAPEGRQAQFVIDMISQSVCDLDGKLTVAEDDVDDSEKWPDPKRNAYFTAIVKYQSPTLENAAKNSSSTTSVAT